jgi:hypothetical protein
MTTMSMLVSRTAIVPVWLLVLGLLVLSGSPMTFATGVVLLFMGGMVLTVMLARWKERPAIAAMTLDPPLATLPSTGFAPNLWPNSGFRNIRQRGTRRG